MTRFSKEQIAYALELIESGTPVGKACRQLGMSEAALYKWRKKYGGTRRTYRRAIPTRVTSDKIAATPDASGS